MRAIIFATGYQKEMEPLVAHRPTPLLNIADKPILFHVIEYLARNDVKQYDIILYHIPESIEEKLGNGQRWGIQITYHLAKKAEQPFSPLKVICKDWGEEAVVLAQGDVLPNIGLELFKNYRADCPFLLMFSQTEWSGWGSASAKFLSTVKGDLTFDQFPGQIRPYYQIGKTTPFLSTTSFKNLKNSNFNFLNHDRPFHLFPSTAHMVEPGIWISRAVSLSPKANITGPVFIGEHTVINDGVKLGPNAIVENNCVIDQNSTLQNALICQRSYVGEGLAIRNSIVDRNLLINLTHDTTINIREDFILGELSRKAIMKFPTSILGKCLAAILWVLLSPIYYFLHKSSYIEQEEKLRLPVSLDRSQWETFHWQFFIPRKSQPNFLQRHFSRLPLLENIMNGDIYFVGVKPRSLQEVAKLPKDWLELYLKSKVGFITLADIEYGPEATTDETYASEIYYAVHMGFWYDLRLFFRWIKKRIAAVFLSGKKMENKS